MDTHEAGPREPILAPVDQDGTQAVVRAWLKPSGAIVAKNEPIVELETDKVLVEVCAPCDGTLDIVVAEHAEVTPGSVLDHVLITAIEPAAAHTAPIDASDRLSPSVRKLVAEHAIDPHAIAGSGRGGRVTRADVIHALDRRASRQGEDDTALDVSHDIAHDASADAREASTRVPHTPMRRRIAEHMQQSVRAAPHVTAVFEADFSAVAAHRYAHRDAFAAQGVPLTYTAYLIAASVEAMRAVPEINSRWHDDAVEIFRDIHIGVGTSLGDAGLIVPVIRGAHALSLFGIAAQLDRLTEAARSGTLEPADVRGGTFTISNHGISGALFATPIILHQPQCAILGVGAIEKRVVVREVNGHDALQILPCAYVSLTIDHRALDGERTNAWLRRFVHVIERWSPD
ncbi:dihydrolipoamide acetyltransferase family protein [Pararobbsia silviterrae]|uniref:Dihydrolipoamide acetyltransferase component of pyruvate dehydrogenase complex n=1 Tax=Pararobbsia silviterrae TaxID=1792498 RepID=A0A494Y6A6_9BURK|nr:2-oxo acid dehydrogenase subunit E2 [Pararobbsia silviterrae]RKP55866.1 dihydrolipoamide succinyltransferase [Pararobbsia silviterrae]